MKSISYIFILFFSFSILAQTSISGVVIDQFNEPIPFANVIIKNTLEGTTTDDLGEFNLNTKKENGVLEISFIGFHTQNVNFTTETKYIKINLKEQSDLLEEVVLVSRHKKKLKKTENPAYYILKEIWKRKRINGVKKVNYYQYNKNTSIEIGMNHLDSSFIKKLDKKNYATILDEIEYDESGTSYYVPFYLNQKITNVYGNNLIKEEREDIEAERTEGIGSGGFGLERISKTFRDIDVFKNNIPLLKKSFVSPLSKNGFATYDYVLYDSIIENNKKTYNIYFFPLREQDLAFKGNFFVSGENFSIEKIEMEVTKSANINFVRGLRFEKEFKNKNDSIYIPTKNIYEGNFSFLNKDENKKGVSIKKVELFDKYNLNKKLPDNFYTDDTQKVFPDQYEKPEAYWSEKEDEKLKKTNSLVNKLKQKSKIKSFSGLINTLSSGYINIPVINAQAGPFWTLFGFNEIEGLRTNLGFRTYTSKDDRLRLNGNLAYGFRDNIVKYGGELEYLLSYKPRIKGSIAYRKDYEQLGSVLLKTEQLLGKTFGTSSLFTRGTNFFLSDVEKYAANFDYAVNNNLHLGLNISKANISSASPENFSISYLNDSGNIADNVTDVATDLYLSFTPKRLVYGLGVRQKFGKNLHPSIVLNYRHGYKGFFNGTHDYDKIQIKYAQPILLGELGILDASIELGKTFGEVPVSLLSPIPANQSYALRKNTFTLLNFYDFVTDTYAASHFEHHFNGYILNRIPLLKKLKLRSVITFRSALGSISDENKAINDNISNSSGTSNIPYNTPEKLYYEYGFGIENIGLGNLRILRIDAIWRNNYNQASSSLIQAPPKFAIRIDIRPSL